MTDIWLCARRVQLIRADRIVCLEAVVADDLGSTVAPRTSIRAALDGGLGSVEVAACAPDRTLDVLSDLAAALGEAKVNEDYQGAAAIFIFPLPGEAGESVWRCGEDFPDSWPGGVA